MLRELITTIVLALGILDSDYLSEPAELADIYSQFSNPASRYWVIVDEDTGRVLGGGGFAPLLGGNAEEGIAEIQKMYLAREIQGQGYGKRLLEMIIAEAREYGYKKLYIETVPKMEQAIALYRRYGFQSIPCRLGDTGHGVCTVFMELPLTDVTTQAV